MDTSTPAPAPVAPLPPAEAPPAPPAGVAPLSPEETAALRALLHEVAPLVPYLPALRQALAMLDSFDPDNLPMPARMMMRSMGIDLGR